MSLIKFAGLVAATALYLFLGTTGIVLINPIHDNAALLIFVATVVVFPVVMMWRDIYSARRFTNYVEIQN